MTISTDKHWIHLNAYSSLFAKIFDFFLDSLIEQDCIFDHSWYDGYDGCLDIFFSSLYLTLE